MMRCEVCKKRPVVINSLDGRYRCSHCAALDYLRRYPRDYEGEGRPPPKGKIQIEAFLKDTSDWLEDGIRDQGTGEI